MESICGVFDCSQCEAEEACGGCRASCGRPFGGQCIAAETIKAGGREAYDRLQKELIKLRDKNHDTGDDTTNDKED